MSIVSYKPYKTILARFSQLFKVYIMGVESALSKLSSPLNSVNIRVNLCDKFSGF